MHILLYRHAFADCIAPSIFCSDAAVKQILLQMNERRREENSFVIEDLDQTHLLIKADEEESMRQELEAEVRFLCFA